MTQSPLTITCATIPEVANPDGLEKAGIAKREAREYAVIATDALGLVHLTVHDRAECAAIHLDEKRARELFNWLGVWLHTQ